MAELNLTKENFNTEVLQSKIPVLVDFWATWCGPCRMLAPTIEELAEEFEGKVAVGKINVDEQEALAIQYGINVIPTLLLFKNGEIIEKRTGLRPKTELEALLNQATQ